MAPFRRFRLIIQNTPVSAAPVSLRGRPLSGDTPSLRMANNGTLNHFTKPKRKQTVIPPAYASYRFGHEQRVRWRGTHNLGCQVLFFPTLFFLTKPQFKQNLSRVCRGGFYVTRYFPLGASCAALCVSLASATCWNRVPNVHFGKSNIYMGSHTTLEPKEKE